MSRVEKERGEFNFTLDPHLYVNKRALDFVYEKFPASPEYLAWSNFEFIAADGSINEADLLMKLADSPYIVHMTDCGYVEYRCGNGLVEIDDAEWDIYFGPLRLGRFHERTLQIEDALGRQHRRRY